MCVGVCTGGIVPTPDAISTEPVSEEAGTSLGADRMNSQELKHGEENRRLHQAASASW
jgi:molybdopterin-biosynthesis enzyme MoeA-like protein